MELVIIIGVTALILAASINWIKVECEARLKACYFPTNDTTTFLADYVWICMVTWSVITRHFLLSGLVAIVTVVIVACIAMFIWLCMSLGEVEAVFWGPIVSIISATMCTYVVIDMLYWRGYSLLIIIPIGVVIWGTVAGFRLYYNIKTIRQFNINKESGLIKRIKEENVGRPTVITIFLEETPKELRNRDMLFFKNLQSIEDLIKSLRESSSGHSDISEHITGTLDGLAESTVLKAEKFLKLGKRIKKLNSINSPVVKEYGDMRSQLSKQIKETQDKLADLLLKLDKVEFDKLSGGEFDTLNLEIKALIDGLTSTSGDGTFGDLELDEIAKKYE